MASGIISSKLKNDLNTAINISNYNTLQNAFVAPEDGYLQLGYSTGNKVNEQSMCTIYAANTNNSQHFYISNNATSDFNANLFANAIFIKKGMRIVASMSTNGEASFKSLV